MQGKNLHFDQVKSLSAASLEPGCRYGVIWSSSVQEVTNLRPAFWQIGAGRRGLMIRILSGALLYNMDQRPDHSCRFSW